MSLEEKINSLLKYHFQQRKNICEKNAIANWEELLKLGILQEHGNNTLKLNFDSGLLNQQAFEIAFSMLAERMPDDILRALEYTKKFEVALKQEYKVEDFSSAYSDLIKGMDAYGLLLLDNGTSTYDFLLSLTPVIKERKKRLRNFEETYFQFLKQSNYSIELIYNSCTSVYDKNKKNANPVYKYLIEVASIDHNLSLQVYGFGVQHKIFSYSGFASNLLIGLYNTGYPSILPLAIGLLQQDTSEGLMAFTGFDLKSDEDIKNVFEIIYPVAPNTVLEASHKSFLLCHIIDNPATPEDIFEKSVHQILGLLKSENHEIAHAVFDKVNYIIEKHEYEKYVMLYAYLTNTQNFNVLDDFFYHFKDPKYVFDYIIRRYEAHGFRISISQFEQPILHLWKEEPAKVEKQILRLFEQKSFGLLAVKIMLAGSNYPIPVDIHKLDKEEYQMTALESMCNYPHSIDKLLSTILKFRHSRFPSVQIHVQTLLSKLIFDAYHESIFRLIESQLSTWKDRKFLSTLKKSLLDYEQMKEFKDIRDLDPRQNERSLMDLYYSLEHENQAKLMKNEDRGGLSSLFKSVAIVRGKAWKVDDDDEVRPMGLIEASMMIDSRAYKNPIMYEQKLGNF